MKKIVSVVLAALMMLALAGCQVTINKDDGVADIDPQTAVAGVMSEFLTGYQDQLPAFMEVDAETLEAVYGIPAGWVDAYVCRIPMMNVHATEIFVAHVTNGNMDNVNAAVEARQQALETTWERYLPAQYELVKNSVTEVSGHYILFAVTEHTESIKDIFAKATK